MDMKISELRRKPGGLAPRLVVLSLAVYSSGLTSQISRVIVFTCHGRTGFSVIVYSHIMV